MPKLAVYQPLKTLKKKKTTKIIFGHLPEKNGERASGIGLNRGTCRHFFTLAAIGHVSCCPTMKTMNVVIRAGQLSELNVCVPECIQKKVCTCPIKCIKDKKKQKTP